MAEKILIKKYANRRLYDTPRVGFPRPRSIPNVS
jgi:hypothetical protein